MRIQFLQDTTQAQIPTEFHNEGTVVVYREGFNPPPLVPGARVVEWRQFKASYLSLNPDCLVVVGLNRIMTPSNRTELVFEWMQTMTTSMPKFSIDTEPFLGEPWRVWFHYSIAYGEWLGVTYSYAVESDWQKWFYREADTCLLAGGLSDENRERFITDLPKRESVWEFREPLKHEIAQYDAVKQTAFDKYSTPKQIIGTMLKGLKPVAEASLDDWRNPGVRVLPDLNIYRFVAEENRRREDVWNHHATTTDPIEKLF